MREFPSNVVILGDPLTGSSFDAVMSCLFRSVGKVYIYCNGGGGNGDIAFAIVDICRHRGNVVGILVGAAASAHGVIWAGMPERYAMPLAALEAHLSGMDEVSMKLDTTSARQLSNVFDEYDKRMSRVFSEMGQFSEDWWYQELQGVGSNYVKDYSAEWLVSNGLCKPSSELVMELEFDEEEE